MLIANIIQKTSSFPFRSRMGEIVKNYSVGMLLHLVLRWWSCPFDLLKTYIPREGVIYDLGCGHGLMLYSLAMASSFKVNFIGVDIDKRKISFARDFNRYPHVKFEAKDMSSALDLSDAACIILNDALYLISFSDQENLLRRCFGCLGHGGVLVIKEIERCFSWKYFFARIQEFFVIKVFHLTCAQGFYFRSRHSFVAILKEIGFKVEALPIHKGYPYSHILYFCQKE